jgi:hypothetical protein
MGSILVRGNKLYAKVQALGGTWQRHATNKPDTPEGRRDVEAWIKKTERDVAAQRAAPAGAGGAGPLTVECYTYDWLDRRHTKTVGDDKARLRRFVSVVECTIFVSPDRPVVRDH